MRGHPDCKTIHSSKCTSGAFSEELKNLCRIPDTHTHTHTHEALNLEAKSKGKPIADLNLECWKGSRWEGL